MFVVRSDEAWERALPSVRVHSGAKIGVTTRALLLTGVPGVGKTTIIQKVACGVTAGTTRGFFTEEIREGGVRKGFRLVPFDGLPRVLSHVDLSSRYRVGKYKVDVAMLEEVAPALLGLDPAVQLYLVDEIGKMECLSPSFVTSMRGLLNAGVPLLATVAQRGEGFIAEVKRRPDVSIWEVNRRNRDVLSTRLIEWVKALE